jgi:TonB family protein
MIVTLALLYTSTYFGISNVAIEQPPITPMPQAIGKLTCPAYTGQTIGEATVAFRIAADGSVTDVKIARSSGKDFIDKDAIQCVGGWRYTPIVADGKPAEISWQATIKWHTSREWTPLDTTRIGKACDGVPIPPPTQANEQNAETGTTLLFRVSADGVVKDAFIARSSGSAAFDAMALQCAANWRYQPAIPNGSEGEVEWSARVAWNPSVAAIVNFPSRHFDHDLQCGDALYPQGADEGTTVLALTITGLGAVDGVSVANSSGNAALDSAATACANSWRYVAPKPGDPASRIPWGAEVYFRAGHIYVLERPGRA